MKRIAATVAILAVLALPCVHAAEQKIAPGKTDANVHLTAGPGVTPEMVDGVIAADLAVFRAVFDTCDVEALSGMVTDDLEFFHDKGGLTSTTGKAFLDSIHDKCERQKAGTDFLSSRELDRDSVKVYAINNYGAIEIGTHRFYALVEGKPKRLTETAQFTMVWKKDGERWRLARVLSYDHRLAP